ncbi:MAG: hypothetical protein DHS20C11_32420 [Lysobacteraceae bacterium]|nr:MAG: hypothetical protein DHS20C11_32420 [Xanthomonadaceae bacterium]
MAAKQMDQSLNARVMVWWAVPWSMVLMELAIRAFAHHRIYAFWYESGEWSVNEIATFLVLVAAIVVGIKRLPSLPSGLTRWWMLLLVAGCVYFAGEEISWGQHWLGWETPPQWQAINDQGETNLHNTSSWLDQKPRQLLELWILFGLIVYAYCRRGAKPPVWAGLWPSVQCLGAAFAAILIRLPERITTWLNADPLPLFSIRLAETQELMFAFFLLAFMTTLARKPQ